MEGIMKPLPVEMSISAVESDREIARAVVWGTIEGFLTALDAATIELHSGAHTDLHALSDQDLAACRTFLLQTGKYLSQVKSTALELFQIETKISLAQIDALINELTAKYESKNGSEIGTSLETVYTSNSKGDSDVKTEAHTLDSDTDNYEPCVDIEIPSDPLPTQDTKQTKSRKSKPRKSKIKFKEDSDDDSEVVPKKKRKTKVERKTKVKVEQESKPKVKTPGKSPGRRRTWPCLHCDHVSRTRTLLHDHESKEHGIEKPKTKPILNTNPPPPKEPQLPPKKTQPPPPTQQQTFECEVCNETFDEPRKYFRHRKFYHPDHFFKHGGLKEEADRMGLENGINDIIKEQALAGIVVDETVVDVPRNDSTKPAVVAGSFNTSYGIKKQMDPSLKCVCDVCGKLCKSSALLRMHMRIHTLPHQCDTCGKRLATSSQLKIHERLHTGEEPFVCKHCGATFRYSTPLHTHMYTYHSSVKPYRCETCDVGFRFKRSLTLHYQSKHSNVRPYQCLQCDKGFVEKVYYDLHMAQHTGVRDLKCEKCDATFCTKPGLNKHIRITHSDKTVVCHICAKSFNHHSKLQSHMKAHSGERPYVCTVCDKSFTWSHLLKQHMRTHTGEKPFKCEHCGRSFLCSGNLTKHRRTHQKKEQQQKEQSVQQNDDKQSVKQSEIAVSQHLVQHQLATLAQVNQVFNLTTAFGYE